MANEPTTTITGNLTADPELRFTPTGQKVAAFTIANTPRFPDRATGEWQDGETWFVRCSAWGDTAENIAASLSRGNAVVATGRLRCRTWEDHRRRQAGHGRDDRGRHRPEPAPRRRQGHQGHPRARRRQRHRRPPPLTSGAPPRPSPSGFRPLPPRARTTSRRSDRGLMRGRCTAAKQFHRPRAPSKEAPPIMTPWRSTWEPTSRTGCGARTSRCSSPTASSRAAPARCGPRRAGGRWIPAGSPNCPCTAGGSPRPRTTPRPSPGTPSGSAGWTSPPRRTGCASRS